MTFPYLKETYDIPGFYIDVPYEKNKDSVCLCGGAAAGTEAFSGRSYRKEHFRGGRGSRQLPTAGKHASNYQTAVDVTAKGSRSGYVTITNELYAIFMCHLLAGSEAPVRYTEMLLDDVKKAPKGRRPACAVDAHHAISYRTR